MARITDEEARRQVEELLGADAPARLAEPGSYPLQHSIALAKAGNKTEAAGVLLAAAALLRRRDRTFQDVSFLPDFLADYVAEVLEGAVRGKDPAAALRLKTSVKGRKTVTNAARNQFIASLAGSLQKLGVKDFLEETANQLQALEPLGVRAPRKGSAWTPEAVSAAIAAHRALTGIK